MAASVFKVMVMAGTLLEAQKADRPVSEREMELLTPMITESTNSPVRSLWRSFGGSPWFSEQGEIFDLTETLVRGDDYSSWGGTRTSARDQVNLLRQVLLGEWGDLDAEYRYAVVGHPSRRYLWILSREPTLDPSVQAGVLERLDALGFEIGRLRFTPQPSTDATAASVPRGS